MKQEEIFKLIEERRSYIDSQVGQEHLNQFNLLFCALVRSVGEIGDAILNHNSGMFHEALSVAVLAIAMMEAHQNPQNTDGVN